MLVNDVLDSIRWNYNAAYANTYYCINVLSLQNMTHVYCVGLMYSNAVMTEIITGKLIIRIFHWRCWLRFSEQVVPLVVEVYIDGLAHDCINVIANALEYFTKPSIYIHIC